MLETPLHDWHIVNGARMVDFAGWHMPIQYGSIVDEHQAVRKQAGLFDISHMGRLMFNGPDTVKFLDHILTNHVARLSAGQVRYSLVCNESGGILDDVLVYRFNEDYMLVVNGANREKIVAWIEKHSEGFDFEMRDDTANTEMVALQGPKSLEILQPHTPCDLAAMNYYTVAKTTVFGFECLLSRTGYTGEDGFEIIVRNEDGIALWEQLLDAGKGSLSVCGLGCRDTLRLEAAMPLYGHEMDESVDPITAGLKFGVKLYKENFIGKEALVELSQRTDLPVRVGIELEGKRIAREGSTLFVGDVEVGEVCSGTFSPTFEKPIAMGYVPKEHAGVGTSLLVDIRGKRHPGQVVELPFYKRS